MSTDLDQGVREDDGRRVRDAELYDRLAEAHREGSNWSGRSNGGTPRRCGRCSAWALPSW